MYFWSLDKNLFERHPHNTLEVKKIDFYHFEQYIIRSDISKPIHWKIDDKKSWTRRSSLMFPCDSKVIISFIFEMVSAMNMEVSSFGIDPERNIIHIALDDMYFMKEAFDDEYQAIFKLYHFVWKIHNDMFCPSICDFSGLFDIQFDEFGTNYVELYDIIALGSFMQEYDNFARRGDIIPLNHIRSFQNLGSEKWKEKGALNIGKAALLEGDFLIRFVPGGP